MLAKYIRNAVSAAIDDAESRRQHITTKQIDDRLARLDRFAGMVVSAGLKRLLSAKNFSICDLDALMRVAGVHGHDGVYAKLRCLHCMDWSDMGKELQQEAVHHIIQIFEDSVVRIDIRA